MDKLEEIYRKPLIEIRADLKPDIKESLLIDKMRQKVVSGVKVTPREVKRFYENIPVDSLPFLPAEVDMFHLVKRPTATDEPVFLTWNRKGSRSASIVYSLSGSSRE